MKNLTFDSTSSSSNDKTQSHLVWITFSHSKGGSQIEEVWKNETELSEPKKQKETERR